MLAGETKDIDSDIGQIRMVVNVAAVADSGSFLWTLGLGLFLLHALLSQAKHLQLVHNPSTSDRAPPPTHHPSRTPSRTPRTGRLSSNPLLNRAGPTTALPLQLSPRVEHPCASRSSSLIENGFPTRHDPITHHGYLYSLRKRHLSPPPKSLF